MPNKSTVSIVAGLCLFVLVLIGVYLMQFLARSQELSWLETFAPIIVLTGFFIFILAAGLVLLGIFYRVFRKN